MCTILFAYKSHPKYDLIVAANRDEFFGRPTKVAHYWEDYPYILAGRDLEKMGTWMGITTDGKFAGLTNFRFPNEDTAGKKSRGKLVSRFLKSNIEPVKYLTEVAKNSKMYPAFNLLVGKIDGLFYYSNVENEIKKLTKGIHGISNHLLNSKWPKVEYGKREMAEIIKGDDQTLVSSLFQLLKNTDEYPDDVLPNTGVPLQSERKLSSLFIKNGNYGTRSSTVILFSKDEIIFNERTYKNDIFKTKTFEINYKAF